MNSAWSQTATSNDAGEFRFDNVPLGAYTIKVEAAGFAAQSQSLTLASGTEARLHFPLTVSGANESVEVRDSLDNVNPESSTATTIVNRDQIAATPGATSTNSFRFAGRPIVYAVTRSTATRMRIGRKNT